jgi:hypothetical protein
VLKHLRPSDIEPLLKMLVDSGELELVIDRSRPVFVVLKGDVESDSENEADLQNLKRLDYHDYQEILWAYGQQPTEEGFAKLSSSVL